MKTSTTKPSLDRIIEHSHQTLKRFLGEYVTAIDMTIGNGFDTLFLAKSCKKVYGFDIQEAALMTTRNRLNETGLNNIELILDCHSNFKHYVKEPFRVVVFNLGYLPTSDKTVTTLSQTTLNALRGVLEVIEPGGIIAITVYPGHLEGDIEARDIEAFVKTLPSQAFTVLKYQIMNRHKAPYNIYINKH